MSELLENSRTLADLASLILWRLEYEREAAVQTLFDDVPPFRHERELLHLMWWQSLDAVRIGPALIHMIRENRQEMKEITSRAKKSDSPDDYLAYARELLIQMKAADHLIGRLKDARS